jgi:MYXO-CTERM domain-containing protein
VAAQSPEVAGTNFARPAGQHADSDAPGSAQLETEMLALVLLALVTVRLRRRIKA